MHRPPGFRARTRLPRRYVGFAVVLAGATAGAAAPDPPSPGEPAAVHDDSPPPEPQTSTYGAAPLEGPRRNLFSLQRLDAAIELSGEFEQRRVDTPALRLFDDARQRNSRLTLDEQLLLELDATVLDPSVLNLYGTLGLGLTQERFRETYNSRTDIDRNDGFLSTYDLRADFLQGRAFSGTAYGLKSEDRFSRAFLPSLREERNDYGTALYWADDELPMELTYDHRSTNRTGSRDRRDDENLTEDQLRYQATWISSQQHSLRLNYEYTETAERLSGSRYRFDNVRNQIRLEDELLFGDARQHRLDTTLRLQDEQGDYARDLFEFTPRLSLQHSDTLSTNYQYQYAQEEIGRLEIASHRLDWTAVHQAFTNLTTTSNLFGLSQRVEDDSQTAAAGGSIDFSYTRDNRWGRFSANLGLSHESERSHGDGTRAVVAESGAFVDPLPIVLSRPAVVRWTLVVRDTRRIRLYLPGLDYFVRVVGGRTLLFRNPLGRIAIGETVSIDYLYRQDGDQSRDAQRVDLRLQQDSANGLTPYYTLQFRHDDLDAARSYFGRYRDYESNRHLLGLRYRGQRWNAGAEFEFLQDTVDPFTAFRVYGGVDLLRQPGKTIDARADLAHYIFDSAGRDEATVVELALSGRADLNTVSDAYLTSTYRYEHDGSVGRGVIHGVDLEAGLSRRWGQLTVTASVEYDLLRIVDSQEDGVGVWLKVRRDIPNALGALRPR